MNPRLSLFVTGESKSRRMISVFRNPRRGRVSALILPVHRRRCHGRRKNRLPRRKGKGVKALFLDNKRRSCWSTLHTHECLNVLGGTGCCVSVGDRNRRKAPETKGTVRRLGQAIMTPGKGNRNLRLCYSRLCPNRSYCPVCFDDGLFDIIRISRKSMNNTLERISIDCRTVTSGWPLLWSPPN